MKQRARVCPNCGNECRKDARRRCGHVEWAKCGACQCEYAVVVGKPSGKLGARTLSHSIEILTTAVGAPSNWCMNWADAKAMGVHLAREAGKLEQRRIKKATGDN